MSRPEMHRLADSARDGGYAVAFVFVAAGAVLWLACDTAADWIEGVGVEAVDIFSELRGEPHGVS